MQDCTCRKLTDLPSKANIKQLFVKKTVAHVTKTNAIEKNSKRKTWRISFQLLISKTFQCIRRRLRYGNSHLRIFIKHLKKTKKNTLKKDDKL